MKNFVSLKEFPMPKHGKEVLTRNDNQGGVLKLMNWNKVHNFWESKGNIVNKGIMPTHWTGIPTNDTTTFERENFGGLLTDLYSCETNFTIEWMWDGGVQWSFTQVLYTGKHDKLSEKTIKAISDFEIDGFDTDRDFAVIGRLIIIEYFCLFNGFDSNDEQNSMYKYIHFAN